MPSDGTLVSLGLGQLVRTRPAKLVTRPLGRRAEEIPWMAHEHRAAVLEASMGSADYFQAWSSEEAVMTRLQSQRRASKKDETDMTMMPRSFAEARQRALQVAADVGNVPFPPKRSVSLAFFAAPSPAKVARKAAQGSPWKEVPAPLLH